MWKRHEPHTPEIAYDSLTDIISNMLGVCIFIALLAVFTPRGDNRDEPGNTATRPGSESRHVRKSELVLVNRDEELPIRRKLDGRFQLFFFANENRLVFIDRNEIVRRFNENLSENMDGLSVDMEDYLVVFEPVAEGDLQNHWFHYFINPDMKSPEEPDLSVLGDGHLLSTHPPEDTMIVLMSFPSAHEVAARFIEDCQSQGFLVSWFPSTDQYEFSWGYSHTGVKPRVD